MRLRHPMFGAVLVLMVLASAMAVIPASAETPADHGVVAPTTPRTDAPIVLDGKVEASVQFDDMIVVAGSFTRVELPNGDIVDRSYIFAYNINTGAYIAEFDPTTDREVLALEVADDGSGLFIAGKFNTVDGVARRKVAKIDSSGQLMAQFTANTDAKVATLDDDGSRLYLGGSFTTLNGAPRVRLAAVDITSGAVSTFRNDVTVDVGRSTGAVKTVDVSPDGSSLLVIHASARVAGLDRFGVAQIDLTTDQVSPWQTDWYKRAIVRCSGDELQVRDGSYSPDGSYFVVAEKGGRLCDKVIAFPTADGVGLEENLWVLQAFDSVYSVGVSDVAIYLGGHFCFLNPLGPIPTSQAAEFTHVRRPQLCRSGGNNDTNGISARYQVAALQPATGELHDWNPGINVQEGIFDIEVIDRGVLLGHDRDRFNNVRTGRHTFLDFGGVTPPGEPPLPPPPPAVDTCRATALPDGVQLDWNIATASPNRVQIRRDGRWLTTVQAPTTTYSDFNGPVIASYLVRYRADGVVTDLVCEP